MKKTALLLAITAAAISANAQITLTGSSYTQNFDGLPAYPTGWATYNSATSTSLGTIETIQYFGKSEPHTSPLADSTVCIGSVNVGGFKNFPSADVCHQDDDFCATSPSINDSYLDRALGVRQVSYTNGTHPHLDSGAAFVLKISNTTAYQSFTASFKLQSLDTSTPRVTTWAVDYGIGSTPTSFIPVSTTGIMTTGGRTFSNNNVTANFGTALDNKSSIVYIRIVALAPSSGSGSRASSAIDDFTLTYVPSTAVSTVSTQPELSLTTLGTSSSDRITLAYSSEEAANYVLSIYDMAGRTIHTQNVAAVAGTQSVTVNGLHLAPGMYIAKMINGNSSSVARVIVQ